MAQRSLQDDVQLCQANRLGQKIGCASLHGIDGNRNAAAAREHHNGTLRRNVANMLQKVNSRLFLQDKVNDRQIPLAAAELLPSLGGGRSYRHRVTNSFEILPHLGRQQRVIVHEEQLWHRG
jgi:hypothetical protein